jgi:hypothetical protein
LRVGGVGTAMHAVTVALTVSTSPQRAHFVGAIP